MPVLNNDVTRIFNLLADLLGIESANAYRVRAYRNAARTIASLPREGATGHSAKESKYMSFEEHIQHRPYSHSRCLAFKL
jgi:DNA polymerase/3'-5' exonuclease PolX